MSNSFFIFGINLSFGLIPITSDPCDHLWARVVDLMCSGFGSCSGCHANDVSLFYVPFMLDSFRKYHQFTLVRVYEKNQKCNGSNQR